MWSALMAIDDELLITRWMLVGGNTWQSPYDGRYYAFAPGKDEHTPGTHAGRGYTLARAIREFMLEYGDKYPWAKNILNE